MAVKVMLAPSIAQRAPKQTDEPSGGATAKAKPKRRRSSVYDADGNEVFITLMCLKCHKMRPLSQFGLRKMADGAIRNQPWCRTCRSSSSDGVAPKRRERTAAASGAGTGGAPVAEPVVEREVVDAGTLAAQVVAALHGGRR